MIAHFLETVLAGLIEAVGWAAIPWLLWRGYRAWKVGRVRLPFRGDDLADWFEYHAPPVDGFGAWRRCDHLDDVPPRYASLVGAIDVPAGAGYAKTDVVFVAEPLAPARPRRSVRAAVR